MPRKDAGGGPISAQAQQDLVSEGIENFELPKSLVTKIAKSAVRCPTWLAKHFR
jgi:DNA polymerase epsilon subunit 3